MSWKPLTDLQVLEEFTPSEKAALQGIQAQEALPSILQRTIDAVRGSILAGGNRIGPDGTIPDQLAMDVIAIARWRWLASFPALKQLQTDARKALHDDAQATLKDIAAGKVKVEVPDAATAITAPSPVNGVAVVRAGRNLHTTSFDTLSHT